MAKNKEHPIEAPQGGEQEIQQAGQTTIVVTAETVEDLNNQVAEHKRSLREGESLTAGAVGQERDTGRYIIILSKTQTS